MEPRNMNPWTPPREGRELVWRKQKILCQEETDGVRPSPTPKEHKTTSGKLSVSTVTEKGISLAIVRRNDNDPVNNANGNHGLALVEIARLTPKKTTNKYVRSVMTALQNKGPRIGFPTSPTNKTTLKNSSCSRCWELRDRIFKELEPDGLGKSYSL